MSRNARQFATHRPNSRTAPVSHIRIIGGQYRRRLVGFIDADGLRPTPDRVRETLFNWLDPYLPNARVLDCCAGSGVLGFEALSRGATHVDFIEPNPAQLAQLRQTATTLGIANTVATFYGDTAQQVLDKALATHQPYDIVFVDPPYAMNLWQTLLQRLLNGGWVTTDSLLYIEADHPLDSQLADCLAQFDILKHKKMGQLHIALLRPLNVPLTNDCQ